MDFKEQIKKDNINVFMDLKTFGEEKLIDGKLMTVMVDKEELLTMQKNRIAVTDGIYRASVLFYVSIEDMRKVPVIGSVLKYGNRDYIVSYANNDEGIVKVILERNRGK